MSFLTLTNEIHQLKNIFLVSDNLNFMSHMYVEKSYIKLTEIFIHTVQKDTSQVMKSSFLQ